MINVLIDELTPCLKDLRTGELVQTEVVRIVRKSFLRKYNEATGWYTNWAALLDECEVYALVAEGTVNIQGLVAVADDQNAQALRASWMCTSPENNKLLTDEPRYSGVGGHLFAIAAQISQERGFDGYLYGFAANKKLLEHYQETFGAEHLGIFHPYHFMVNDANAQKIREAYDYEWTDEQI